MVTEVKNNEDLQKHSPGVWFKLTLDIIMVKAYKMSQIYSELTFYYFL